MKSKILILAGGTGTRLWPLSTDEKPKQFQSFFDERTLLQMAYDRVSNFLDSDIYISTNQRYAHLVKRQLPEIPVENIIAEPSRRDTAPCIAFAMKYISDQVGDDAVITIINADQLIKDQIKLQQVIEVSQNVAFNSDQLVLVSVETTFANPNLGYIKVGRRDSIKSNNQHGIAVYELDRFVEKPDIKTAKKYHRSPHFFWNTAIFTWQIKTFFKHLQLHSQSIYKNVMSIVNFNDCLLEYNAFEKISIDYALLEKVPVQQLTVIPADLGWSDVGTWRTMFDESPKDEYSNLVKGKFRYANVKNSVLINETDKEAVAYNLENKFYVITNDTSIVGDLEDSSRLKKIFS